MDASTTARSDVVERGAVLGASLVLASLVAACGSQPPDGGETQPRAESGPTINAPKDAATVPPCDLLPPEDASSLGLDPGSGSVSGSDENSCGWYSPDETDRLALTAIPNRTLASYLDNRAQFADFAELTIAGHPAVRANRNDPKQLGTCSIFLATKDDQVLSSLVRVSDKSKDACGLAQRALEAAVPRLPAAE
nr:DUF3558 domain-containing protein [Saccharopolyspora hordei]